SDRYLNGMRRHVMLLGDFEGNQPVDTHGNNRQVKMCCQKSYSAAEWRHLTGLCTAAFWKDHHAITAVHQFAGKAKALTILGPLRQREDIKEQRNQRIAHLLPPPLQKEPIL